MKWLLAGALLLSGAACQEQRPKRWKDPTVVIEHLAGRSG